MTNCRIRTYAETWRREAVCRLAVDCSLISTAQQKQIDFRRRRVFSNKRVAAGMRIVKLLATPMASTVRSVLPFQKAASVKVSFRYAYPKGTPKKNLIDLAPMPVGADLDNRAKSVIDALTQAGWWDDDRQITTLLLEKRRTTQAPHILVTVTTDDANGSSLADIPQG